MPVGNTDSERAFCWLLQELRQRFGSNVATGTSNTIRRRHALTLEISGSANSTSCFRTAIAFSPTPSISAK
jgi:predicted glutamine amidotransferase